jgi:hypothetical protein
MTADVDRIQERSDAGEPEPVLEHVHDSYRCPAHDHLCNPVIIEWPAPCKPGAPLAGWGCAIFDAGSGKMITTVSQVLIPAVRVVPERWIECELTMSAGEDGEPVIGLEPGTSGMSAVLDDDGNVRTGTFRFMVAEMRVAQK